MNKKKILRTILPGIRTKLSFSTAILVISILAVTSAIHYNQQKIALEEKLDSELKSPLDYINSVVLDLENLNRSLVIIEEFKIRVKYTKKNLSKFKKIVVSKETGFLGSLKDFGKSIGMNVQRANVYRSVDTYFTRYLSEKELENFESKVRNQLRKETGAPIDPKSYEKIRNLAERTAIEKIASETFRNRNQANDDELMLIETKLLSSNLDEKFKIILLAEKEKLRKEKNHNDKSIPKSEQRAVYFETALTKALQYFFRESYRDRISSLGLFPDKVRIFAYDKVGKETLDTGLLFPQSSNTGKKLLTHAEFLKNKTVLFNEKDALRLIQGKSKPENYDIGGRQYEVVFRPVFRNPYTAERARLIYESMNQGVTGYEKFFEEDRKLAGNIAKLAIGLKARLMELKKDGKIKPGSDSKFKSLSDSYRKLIKQRESLFNQLQPNEKVFKEAIKWRKDQLLALGSKDKEIAKEIREWQAKNKLQSKDTGVEFTSEEIQDNIRNLESQAEETRDLIARLESTKDDWSTFKERKLNDSVLELREAALKDFAFVPFKSDPSGLFRYYQSAEDRQISKALSESFREWILAGNAETELPKMKGNKSFSESGILIRSRSEAESMMYELDSTPLLLSKENQTGLIYTLLKRDLLGYNLIIIDRTAGIRLIWKNRNDSIRYAATIGLVAIILTYLLAWFFVRKIKVISRKAEEIEKGNLNVVFPPSGYDEIGILSESLNDMVRGLKEREEMRGELAAAEEIQKRLLPDKLPTSLNEKIEISAFYKAMAGVGGDYYDFIELSDGKMAFCIGDVSNHGVGPAIVMALFRSQLRAIFRKGERNLKKILLEVNATLYEDTPDHIFVTFFLGIYDSKSSQVEYISAGHVKPLLYDASKNKVRELPAGGLPLGMDENSFFETTIERRSLVMDVGDVFFQYTDGLDEARSLTGEFLGRGKVMEFLLLNGNETAKTITEKMVKAAELHTGQNLNKPGMSELSDDIAMIAIRKI